jgi:N-acetylneuraminic acid mutarotase
VEIIGTGEDTYLQLKTQSNCGIWNQRNIKVVPAELMDHEMTFDSLNNVVVLYGGTNVYGTNNETWTFNVATDTWEQQSPLLKPEGYGFAMDFDSYNNQTIVFGGVISTWRNDTWVYDLQSDAWTLKNPILPVTDKAYLDGVYDSENKQFIIFSGWNNSGLNKETWAYNVTSNAWTQMAPTTTPAGRVFHSMAYATTIKKTILFGGTDWSTLYYNDTWEYDYNIDSWSSINSLISPPSRIDFDMVYDSHNNVIVLFGGTNASSRLGDTWLYDIPTSNWTQRFPTNNPSARSGHAMAYDPDNNCVVLFGGYDANGYNFETWTYDVLNNTWTEMNLEGKPEPSGRAYISGALNTNRNKIVMFGGWDNALINETWTYDVDKYEWRNTNSFNPEVRIFPSMTYDSENDKVVLFGGTDRVILGKYFNDLWLYDVDSNIWSNPNPSAFNRPQTRADHEMIYDSANKKIILFGGNDNGTYLNDTWVYDVTLNTWTEKFPVVSPPARADFGMTYDAANQKVVLFGGFTTTPSSTIFDDTWTYDLKTNTWTKQTPASKPPNRYDHKMVYDAISKKVLCYGGSTNYGSVSEVWAYNPDLNVWTEKCAAPEPGRRYGHIIYF